MVPAAFQESGPPEWSRSGTETTSRSRRADLDLDLDQDQEQDPTRPSSHCSTSRGHCSTNRDQCCASRALRLAFIFSSRLVRCPLEASNSTTRSSATRSYKGTRRDS